MKVDKHISSLLFDHDCVIVPEFGGFVTRYKHAQVHPVEHQLIPPSKHVAFNARLKNNDGLLANQIADSEALTYAQALAAITTFVNECNNSLHKNSRVTIDAVGTLRFDPEQNIQFDPDQSVNYLTSSFGLTMVQSPPVKRAEPASVAAAVVQMRQPLKPVSESKPKRKFPWAAVLLLPAVGLFMWVSYQTFNIYKNKLDYGNLNPFAADTNIKDRIRTDEAVMVVPENNPAPTQENLPESEKITNSETVTPLETKLPVEKPVLGAKPADENVKAITPATNAPAVLAGETGTYFIIGGCFEVDQNATRLVKKLHQKGFTNAAVVDTNRNGLLMVAITGFKSLEEARAQLPNYRAQLDTALWVHRK